MGGGQGSDHKEDRGGGGGMSERFPWNPQLKVEFEGSCPFLMCLETLPHSHPVCPDCGAVRFGNLGCKTCREYHEIIDP